MDISQEKNDEIKEEKEQKELNPKPCLTKDDLIFHIKEWIKIDNEIINLKSQVKEKNIKKKELTESLVNVMKSNSIDCFDINGGSLIYKQKKNKTYYIRKILIISIRRTL